MDCVAGVHSKKTREGNKTASECEKLHVTCLNRGIKEKLLFLFTDITGERLRKKIANDVYSIMDHSVHSDWSVAAYNTCVRRSSVV